MATWLNHAAIAAPRNGTTTHTVTPSAGTVVAGTAFTPTAGRLLVVFVEGSVTSTTPTGWALPSGGSAINNTGLYVWYRTAAGSDSLATTHNGSDYPVIFDFYEFAAGSTFDGAASATGVAYNGGAGPTLTVPAGTRTFFGAAGQQPGYGTATWTWASGTKQADAGVPTSGEVDYSATTIEGSTATSVAIAATSTVTGATVERLMAAVTVASGSTTRITAALATAWSLAARVLGARQVLWNAAARIASVRAGAWNVAFRVIDPQAAAWNVALRVTGAARTSAWGVTQRLAAVRGAAWNVRVRVIDQAGTAWNVRARLADQQSASWATLQRVTDPQASAWQVRARVARAAPTAWGAAARLAAVAATGWNVASPLTRVLTSLASAWNLAQRVLFARDTAWRVGRDSYRFAPPSGHVRPRAFDPLWSRVPLPAGITVLRGTDGLYRQYQDVVSPELLSAASVAYLGGHTYDIDAQEAADLTAAGYGQWVTNGGA